MMNKIQTLLGAALIGAAAASARRPALSPVTLPANTDTLFLAPVPVADFYGSLTAMEPLPGLPTP